MAVEPTIKLSFLSRRKRLPVLPDQPLDATYGIVWGTDTLPARSLCRIVRFIDRTQAVVLGYIAKGGRVYRASTPFVAEPDNDNLDLVLVRGVDEKVGEVYARATDGSMVRVSEFKGSLSGTMREVADDTTWNTERSLLYQEFMATMFLRHCVFNPHVASKSAMPGPIPRCEKLDEPVELFADMGKMALPDAIESLLYRIRMKEQPAGIEQFAGRVLSRIDLQRLRTEVASRGVKLIRTERTGGIYLVFDHEGIAPEQEAFLLSVETALNRIAHVLASIGCGFAPASYSPSEASCAVLDRTTFEGITAHVDTLIGGAPVEDCDLRTLGSVRCEPGGEWDTRATLATLCEGLNLIVRLDYRFGVHMDDGEISIRFVRPDLLSMPAESYEERFGSWRVLPDDQRARMAREYASRMSLVLAAAAFASNLNVTRCVIGERTLAGEEPVVRAFDRIEFMATLVPLARELVGASLADLGCVDALRRFEVEQDALRIGSPALRLAPMDDDRRLPDDLRDLLLADYANELEVDDDPHDALRGRFDAARSVMAEDPLRAEQEFNEIIEEAQASCVAAELLESHPVQTQFCENHLGRIILPIFVGDTATRIHRAPDALFFAQFELCNMYAQVGAYERALPLARHMLDMASTSMQAHFTLVNVLARLEMFDEVIEVAKHGLRAAYDTDAAAYLFYRMAFAYWRRREREIALACYRLVPQGRRISHVAQEETRELMRAMGRVEPLAFDEAVAILQVAGVPIPPTEELFCQVADAAVMLTDSGFPFLAGRCAYVAWQMRGSDELNAVSRSLLP